MEKERIKVVWLCHLTNAEIQSYLKPFKKVNEYAPWIPMALKVLENDPRLDIYILAPHEYISGIHRFDIRGIHYIFYNAHMPFIGRHWPGFFKWDYISNFFTNKCITKYLVNKIKPDVIHLQGAENAYYSSTILPLLKKYPTILTIQGFISHASSLHSKQLKKRVDIEKKIIQSIPVSFYRTKKMAEDIKRINPKMMLFWNVYGSFYISNNTICVDKKYDVVYFARISREKGIFDLFKAISILKKQNPQIKVCIIGSGDITECVQFVKKIGITNNVYWMGFVPKRQDLYNYVIQAKISVLPTYFDIIPGTIIESMFLGIPVVSYNTDSIPDINENEEVISLVKKGDINALAKAMQELLDNSELRKEKSEKGLARAKEMFVFEDEEIRLSLLKGYKQAIKTFNETK